AVLAGWLIAASMSRLIIRPPGPLPWSDRRSMPASAAIRAASGDTTILPEAGAVATGAASPFASGTGAADGASTSVDVGAGAGVGDGAGVLDAAEASLNRVAMSSSGSPITAIN